MRFVLREAVAIAVVVFLLYAYLAGYYVAQYQARPPEHQYPAPYCERPPCR